ncbi:hypothetical protein [Thalassovita taeanensis]|nr:hypothetical protein [Thalassovita taeanensis]
MQTLTSGYRGLGLLVLLNWDRILVVGMVGIAMAAGAHLRSF